MIVDNVYFVNSDWSAVKTFTVCPMDVNNDEDISGSDARFSEAAVSDETHQTAQEGEI